MSSSLFPFRNNRLSWQITRIIFVAILIIEALMLIPSYYSYQAQLVTQYQRLTHAEFALLLSQSITPEQIMQKVKKFNQKVENQDLQIAQYQLPDGSTKKIISSNHLLHFQFDWPKTQGSKLNKVSVAILQAPVNKALQEYLLRVFGLIIILAAGLTLVTMWITRRRVLKPLMAINTALKSAGDHPDKPEALSLDCRDDNELGLVALNLNRLLEKQFSLLSSLNEKEQALERLNKQLKEKVVSRTNELQETSETLMLIDYERLAAEAQMESLAQFPEENGNPVMRVDKEGYLRFANRASLELLSALGVKCNDPLPIRWRSLAAKIFQNQKKRKINVGVEDRIFLLQCVPIIDRDYLNIYAEDITRQHYSERRAARLAYSDLLTGLPNRVKLFDELKVRLANPKLKGTSRSLLLMDLDRFSALNDSYGQKVGDQLLSHLASRLQYQVMIWQKRENNGLVAGMVARTGADEFALLLESAEYSDFVEQLMAWLAEPVVLQGLKIKISAALGLAVYPKHGDTPEAIYQHALLARRKAQDLGYHQFQVFTPHMGETQQRELRLARDLDVAIREKRLQLYYQPKIVTQTQSIYGSEALLRWQHPELGPISPVEFIPIAEKNELMLLLGDWVLDASLKQYAHWQKTSPTLNVAINLSSQQFNNKDLVTRIDELLKTYHYNPSTVELELTESMLMGDSADAITKLHGLKALGVGLAIDDFGTGYSSFSYLSQFPVDTLKIDRSFVINLVENESDQKISQAIIHLAHSLGMRVVAEGVETEEQLQLLKSWRCDIIQGYYFSKPLPEEEFEHFIMLDN